MVSLAARLARDGYEQRGPLVQPQSSLTGLDRYGPCTLDRWAMVPTYTSLFTVAERHGMRLSRAELRKARSLTIRAYCDEAIAKRERANARCRKYYRRHRTDILEQHRQARRRKAM